MNMIVGKVNVRMQQQVGILERIYCKTSPIVTNFLGETWVRLPVLTRINTTHFPSPNPNCCFLFVKDSSCLFPWLLRMNCR